MLAPGGEGRSRQTNQLPEVAQSRCGLTKLAGLHRPGIFPGDLLWRNFGLTRHGRVVCYDYDELEYLTDCVFRTIPPAPNPEAELADEVWYSVGSHDVFPEEFETFLLGGPIIREAFLRHQPELLRAEFWQECQRRVAAGEVVDFFPYPNEVRFCNRFGGRRAGPVVASASTV